MSHMKTASIMGLMTLFLGLNAHAKSQGQLTQTHTVQIEALGAGIGYPFPSVFYELALSQFAFRIGGSVQPDSYNGVTMINTPLSISYIGLASSSRMHALEVGAGIGLLANVRSDDYDGYGDWYGLDGTHCDSRNDSCEPGTTDLKLTLHAVLGYRLHISFFQFRIGLSPSIAAGFWPLPHLSFGFTI